MAHKKQHECAKEKWATNMDSDMAMPYVLQQAGSAQPHSIPTRPADPNPYTRYWVAMAKKSWALMTLL